MGIRFTLDGQQISEISPEDLKDEQTLLQEQLDSFNDGTQEDFQDLRAWREDKLKATDWMANSDSPTMTSGWQTYRQKLRDITSLSDAPDLIANASFPLAPGESEIPTDALRFVKSHDPLGIGTTSWVGMGTDGKLVEQVQPTIQHSVSTASTTYSTVSSNSIDFNILINNMVGECDYLWKIESSSSLLDRKNGYLTIVPNSSNNGISTVSVVISGAAGTVTEESNINFYLGIAGGRNTVSLSYDSPIASVGVVTT